LGDLIGKAARRSGGLRRVEAVLDNVRFVPMLLQKSFCLTDRKFSGP